MTQHSDLPGFLRLALLTRLLAALLAGGVLALCLGGSHGAEHASGLGSAPVRVIDGDSVQVGDEVFDLYGIDAPELGQICLNGDAVWHCGLDAAYALVKRFVFDPPRCRSVKARLDGGGALRQVICNSGGLPAAMVLLEDGYAMVLDGAPLDYQRAQKQAKRASLGLWRGTFAAPVRWRAGARLALEAGHAPDCPVIGLQTGQGAKIYYVPFDTAFAALKAQPSSAHRCFASDAAARKAGYGRPKPKP